MTQDLMSMPAERRREAEDLAALRELNQAYLDSVVHGDVQRFGELLAPDFLCSPPDGALLDKSEFLLRTAAPRTLERLDAHDVRIRIEGDLAIVHAATTYTTLGGAEGRGRYTDIWARRGGRWLAIAAHVTRL
jgi:ketosteroid isomerase-like protein